jgi:hypothetical protein
VINRSGVSFKLIHNEFRVALDCGLEAEISPGSWVPLQAAEKVFNSVIPSEAMNPSSI